MGKIAFLLFCFLTSPSAFAADSSVRSYFFYQPPPGVNDFELAAVYTDLTLSANIGAPLNIDIKTTLGSLTYHRAFTNNLSAGLTVNYGTQAQNNTSSAPGMSSSNNVTGLGDPQAFVKLLVPLDDASFFASLNFAYSPVQNVQPDSNAPGANRFSGGGLVIPRIGIQGRVSPAHLIGFEISYQNNFPAIEIFKNSDGTSNPNKPNLIVSGGNILTNTVFYELTIPKFVFDVAMSLINRDAQSNNAQNSSYPPALGNTTAVTYGLTATWLLNSQWSILASGVGYSAAPTQLNGFNQSFNSGPINQSQFIVGARYLF